MTPEELSQIEDLANKNIFLGRDFTLKVIRYTRELERDFDRISWQRNELLSKNRELREEIRKQREEFDLAKAQTRDTMIGIAKYYAGFGYTERKQKILEAFNALYPELGPWEEF
jgi:hypothetical protein